MVDPIANFGFATVDLPPTATSTPEDAVRFLVGRLVQAGLLASLQADQVVRQVLRRERLVSTEVGGGFAVPHTRSDVVTEVVGIVGRSTVGLRWPGAEDAQPVRVICLLILPESAPRASLRALQAVALEISKLKGHGQAMNGEAELEPAEKFTSLTRRFGTFEDLRGVS